ncbi:MAG: hypothetical protein ABH846_02690 [Patescibacteria group bacterium]
MSQTNDEQPKTAVEIDLFDTWEPQCPHCDSENVTLLDSIIAAHAHAQPSDEHICNDCGESFFPNPRY